MADINQPLYIDIFVINRYYGNPGPALIFRDVSPVQPQHHVFAPGLTYKISDIRFLIVVTACTELIGKREYIPADTAIII